jgi:NADPH-dependent 2,4-dienoyl-CoA reductase/sulfur reductase-like enzyme/rhodanese-related sulfurtransferase
VSEEFVHDPGQVNSRQEDKMKLRVIGAVAAGTSAAAKARRNSETDDIRIYEMDTDISYSACGMPYWIGGEVDTMAQLVPRDAAYFQKRYGVDVRTAHRVLKVDPQAKTMLVEQLDTGERFTDTYDRLILATGATPVLPPIPGADAPNVFLVRNPQRMRALQAWLEKANPQRALVVGSGFIGLEMAENLSKRGLQVDVVEMADHLMKPLDPDVAIWVQEALEKHGVGVHLSDAVASFAGASMTGAPVEGVPGESAPVDRAVLRSGKTLQADVVIMAVGIRPNVSLAREMGVVLGPTGAIAVDGRMRTNLPDVYAAGDCAESLHGVTGKPFWHPLGSTANKMGRIAGDQVSGGDLTFRGTLGTGIFRLFDATVAQTGLSEKEALREGYDVAVCHNIKPDKPEYFGGEEMLIKAVADRKTGKLLGAQIVGGAGVDKRIDVLATAITFGAKAEDLMHLDLAYAPPFSTTKDPVIYTGMILANDLSGSRPLMTADALLDREAAGEVIQVVDARVEKQYDKSHVSQARSLPHEKIREAAATLDRDVTAVTYCNKGVTGNAAQNILKNCGVRQVYNLSGGHKQYEKIRKMRGHQV